jgi:hypothetical protein
MLWFWFLKTLQREGLKVYSIGWWLCFKNKVCTFGNGKLFASHTQIVYTSVYCHLQKLVGEIDDYIKKAQYRGSNILKWEMFPRSCRFSTEKGSSYGTFRIQDRQKDPSLAFWIPKRQQDRKIINPYAYLDLWQKITDTKKAKYIASVYVYPSVQYGS